MDSSPIILLGIFATITTYQEDYPAATVTTTNMTSLMKRQIWYLHLLMTTASTIQRKALLDTITNDQLRALTEVTHNLLQGNIPLTEAQKRQLRKHKSFLQILGNPKVQYSQKRNALCRKGTVVTSVLKAAAPQLKLFL